MRLIAEHYEEGLGVEKDVAMAREWYVKAAAEENEKAKKWLAAHPK
jgi:TPR repeat protein